MSHTEGRGARLIVQIPCLDEEETLPRVIRGIPRHIPGVAAVEVLVVDDGSTDRTVEVARAAGADHIVRHVGNRGLATAFRTGIDASLRLGADVIVNTDGDDQYPQAEISRLIEPILAGRADVVVADRQTATIEHFSPLKKALQVAGSWTVRRLSGTNIPDAPSGFRAYSREAALRLNVVSTYSYTLETIIQAGVRRTAIAHVPVRTNRTTRPSRLMRSTWSYLKQSLATLVRVYAMYEPLKVFSAIGALVLLAGSLGIARFLYYYAVGDGGGHVQSLVLSATVWLVGFQVLLIGLVADLIAANRRLLEEALYKLRRLESPAGSEDDDARRAPDPRGLATPLPGDPGRSRPRDLL